MNGFNLRDQSLLVTKALPNGAATIYTDGIATENSSRGDFVSPCELVIEAPVLTTAEQPDAKTLKYSVQHDDDPAFGTVVTLAPDVLTQTGAGGAGAAAAEFRFRLPSNVKKHVRVRAVGSAVGNSSTKSVTASLRF